MRYLPSLGVGNIQLIKGKKKEKGISKPFQKKKKKKENLTYSWTQLHREEEISSGKSKGSQPVRDKDAEWLGPGSLGVGTERPERLRLKDIIERAKKRGK